MLYSRLKAALVLVLTRKKNKARGIHAKKANQTGVCVSACVSDERVCVCVCVNGGPCGEAAKSSTGRKSLHGGMALPYADFDLAGERGKGKRGKGEGLVPSFFFSLDQSVCLKPSRQRQRRDDASTPSVHGTNRGARVHTSA